MLAAKVGQHPGRPPSRTGTTAAAAEAPAEVENIHNESAREEGTISPLLVTTNAVRLGGATALALVRLALPPQCRMTGAEFVTTTALLALMASRPVPGRDITLLVDITLLLDVALLLDITLLVDKHKLGPMYHQRHPTGPPPQASCRSW